MFSAALIALTLGDEAVPVPVTEQVAGPPMLVNEPGGSVSVIAASLPVMVAAIVPATGNVVELPLLSTFVTTSEAGPVTLLPLCVADHVTWIGFESLVLPSVPAHDPARLMDGVGVGAISGDPDGELELPHAVAAAATAATSVRTHH